MSVSVSTFSFGKLTLAPGAKGTWYFSWYLPDGNSIFDSSHWYWLSTTAHTIGSSPQVPPDHQSLSESAVEVVSQYHVSEAGKLTGKRKGHWVATFQNRLPNSKVDFYPIIVSAPAII